jgi:hypothetical protein
MRLPRTLHRAWRESTICVPPLPLGAGEPLPRSACPSVRLHALAATYICTTSPGKGIVMLQTRARCVPGVREPGVVRGCSRRVGGSDAQRRYSVVKGQASVARLQRGRQGLTADADHCLHGCLGCARFRSIQALPSVAYSLHENNTNPYKNHCFPAAIISHAVWL